MCQAACSKQLPELFRCQSSIAGYASHCESINRIMPGDCDNPYAVCHHDVLSLTGYAETGLLKTSHRIEVVDAGNLRHGSDRNLDLSDF